jgi:hypothetical protein
MKRLRWIGVLPLLLMLLQACSSDFANAQSTAAVTDNATNTAKNASDLLSKLDLLVEQNRQLENQNHELMNQINSLRQFLAKQSATGAEAVSQDTEPTDSSVQATVGLTASSPIHLGPPGTGQQPSTQSTAQRTAQGQSNEEDDKTLLPGAYGGTRS